MRKIIAVTLLATALAGCQTTVYTPPPRVYYPSPVYVPPPQPVRVCRWEREYNPVYREWVRVERCRIIYR